MSKYKGSPDRREVLRRLASATGCAIVWPALSGCASGSGGGSGYTTIPTTQQDAAADGGTDAGQTGDTVADSTSPDAANTTDIGAELDAGAADTGADIAPPEGSPFHVGETDFSPLFNVGGAVTVDLGGQKLLLVRINTQEIRALSRVCTHSFCDMILGEAGTWLPKQQQLRCNCHGSRFAIDGSVVMGPAKKPLTKFPVNFNATTGQGYVDTGD